MKNTFINLILKHPKKTVAMMLLITAFIGSGLRWFVIDNDFMKMFPKDLPSYTIWEDVQEDFGTTEFLYAAFGKKNEDIYKEDIFKKVWGLSERLKAYEIVDEVISLATVSRIDLDPEDPDWLLVDNLVPKNSNGILNKEQIQSIKTYLDDNPILKSRLITKNEDYTNVIIRPILKEKNSNKIINTADFINIVKPIIDSTLADYEIHYAGQPYLTGETPGLIINDARILLLTGVGMMMMILLLNLRSIMAVLLIMFTIILSVISMNGFMGWLYYITHNDMFTFTVISTSMPIILLTIANSDGVHVLTRFFKELRKNKSHINQALYTTLDHLILPIFLTSITTGFAFLSLLVAPIPNLVGYGLVVSFGVIWAWILSTTLLPALISLISWDVNSDAISKTSYIENFIAFLSEYIIKYPKRIINFGIIITTIGLIGVFLIKVEVNIIKFFKPHNSIRKSTEFVDNNLTGSMSIGIKIDGDKNQDTPLKISKNLKDIDALQSYMQSMEEIRMTISLADIIKEMNKTLHENNESFYKIPDKKQEISQLLLMSNPDDSQSLVTLDYQSGMIHGMIKSISTERAIEISKKIESYISNELKPNLTMQTTGLLIFLRDFVDLVIKSSLLSIMSSIIVITLISRMFFGKHQWALLSVLPLSSAIILNFGLMGIFGIHLSHLTVLLSSIIIGVGVDFAIHYISDFIRNQQLNIKLDVISKQTVNTVGYPILLDVASNMGFAALLFSDFIPLNYMGGLMIFAMFSTSIGTLTLLAGSIELFKRKLST